MPIFEFMCHNCGHKHEQIVMSDKDLQLIFAAGCPKCNKKGCRVQVMSAPGMLKIK